MANEISRDTSLNIQLDNSVKSITRKAAYHLSGVISGGMNLAQNNTAVIYKDRIDFGECTIPQNRDMSGHIIANYYMEYGHVVYRFGSNLKYRWMNNSIDYVGIFAPFMPDNKKIFALIYPRFS